MFGRKNKEAKVFVGLSGGVDSAVSAALLKAQGYDVTGVFIRIALPGYPCSAGADKLDAMRVAAHLRIPFIEVDLSKEYAAGVFVESVKEYARGRTPNPDVLCNKEIKFGALYDFARARGAEYIATGHYARTEGGRLLTSADTGKDQTYFLWSIPESVLPRVLFPVGGLDKTHVRALAKKLDLPNAERKDSQGICFLGNISMEDMLVRELAPQPGVLLNEAGEEVGTHAGAALYTLGQRHGFTLLARPHAGEVSAHFVIGKDVVHNTVTVATSPYPVGAQATRLTLTGANWIGGVENGSCTARYRYRQELLPATLKDEEVTLHAPRYVPEGQSLVLYRGERCLGGGIIEKAVLV